MYRSCYNRTPPIIKLAFNWITMRLYTGPTFPHDTWAFVDGSFFDPLLIKPSSHEYFVARNSSSSLLITLFIFLASRTMYMFDACLNVFGDFVQNFFRCLSFFFFLIIWYLIVIMKKFIGYELYRLMHFFFLLFLFIFLSIVNIYIYI